MAAFLLTALRGFGQDRTITGQITDAANGALPGASVQVKGTSRGTTTDASGAFRIQASTGQTLIVRMVGMVGREITVGNQTTLAVVLQEDADNQLNEVVVTALGQRVEQRSLGYSVPQVKGTELVNVQRDNFLLGLQGRVPGLTVTSTSGLPGASTSLQLRGATSIDGNNQPLFVIDGLPVDNRTFAGTNLVSDRSNRDVDFLNKGANINYNDIESISVLKGPEAAALYGIDASAGAIIITTKKGSKGRARVEYSNNFRALSVGRFPEVQQQFGRGTLGFSNPAATTYFGAKLPENTQNFNNIQNFFQTGLTQQHNLSMAGGSDAGTYNLSLQYVDSKGIVPTTGIKTINLKLAGQFRLSPKMTISPSFNYINVDNAKALRSSNGFVIGLLAWPSNDDARNYLNSDGSRRILLGSISQGEPDNPYFSVNKNKFGELTNQTRVNVTWEYRPLDWLTLTARLGGDIYATRSNLFLHPESWQGDGAGAGTSGGFQSNGAVEDAIENSRLLNGNFLATFRKQFGPIKATLIAGTDVNDRDYRTSVTYGQKFYLPDFNSVNNTDPTTQRGKYTVRQQRVQGAYAQLSLNYADYLYLNLTGRNDWSSTLPPENQSFFYPSASMSFVFTDLPAFKNNTGILTTGRLRLGYGQTGNSPRPYATLARLVPQTTTGGGFAYDFYGGNPGLKPERGESIEIGTELGFFANRLTIDASVYQKTLADQIVNQRLSYGTGFIFGLLNGGKFQNRGLELQIGVVPVRTKDIRWNLTFNFTKLQTSVSNLPANQPEFYNSDTWLYGNARASAFVNNIEQFYDPAVAANQGINWSYYQRGYASATAIGGYGYQRNKNGDILINPTTGLPLSNPFFLPIGDRNPDFTLGIVNSLTYKNFSLSFLLDIRKGGDVFNGTAAYLWRNGLSTKSLDRETPVTFKGVLRDGRENSASPTPNTIQISPILRSTDYYAAIPESEFVERNINWLRLRDITLRYQFSSALLTPTKVFKTASIFVNGTDLFLLTNYSGIDPNVNGTTAASGGVGASGFDYGTVPMPRGFSAGLTVSF